MKDLKMSGLFIVLTVVLLFGFGAFSPASAITWDLTGSGGTGTVGNSLSFLADGVGLTATAWAYDSGFEKAALGQWSTGLGVCNSQEGFSCGSPLHQVDNVGIDDYVLFVFSDAVDLLGVTIDPWGTWDRDVSYWFGNVDSSTIVSVLEGEQFGASFAALGFGPQMDDPGSVSSAPLEVPLNSSGVNALLFSAVINNVDGKDDRFKIKSVTAAVPVPSTFLLFGAGFAGMLAWRWREEQRPRR